MITLERCTRILVESPKGVDEHREDTLCLGLELRVLGRLRLMAPPGREVSQQRGYLDVDRLRGLRACAHHSPDPEDQVMLASSWLVSVPMSLLMFEALVSQAFQKSGSLMLSPCG
jgi:hypothetical protein